MKHSMLVAKNHVLESVSSNQKELNMNEKNDDQEVFPIYQLNPHYTKVLKKGDFPDKGWTETILGAQKEAKKLKYCLVKNKELAGTPYTWFVTVNFHEAMLPKASAALWTKACRKLKDKGVKSFWSREVNSESKLHYHLILLSEHTEKSIKEIFTKSLPKKTEAGWHFSVKRIAANDWDLFAYVGKAKEPGLDADGMPIDDRYAEKRLLLKKGIGLRKVGSLGGFWVNSRARIWADCREVEATIARGLEMPGVVEAARDLYAVYGGDIPFKKIQRDLAYQAGFKAVS